MEQIQTYNRNKNTISDWNITDMVTVKLKLYGIMDALWDKAILLYISSIEFGKSIFPSFATYSQPDKYIGKRDYIDYAHTELLRYLSKV